MKCKKETDYRTADPKAVYELKKVVLRLRRKGKEIREICEITGLADKTVRMTFEAYDAGGINAIKPKKRGRKAWIKQKYGFNVNSTSISQTKNPHRLRRGPETRTTLS